MKQTGRSLKDLADCMYEYPHKQVNVPVRDRKSLDEMSRLQNLLAEFQSAMGDKGRAIVRGSGMAKKVRILVEARDAGAVDQWTRELVDAIGREIRI